eukprot:11226278-Lingulodinium_polyedra.AAC.1
MAEVFALATAMLWCRHHGIASPTLQLDAALAIGAAEQALDGTASAARFSLLAVLRGQLPGVQILHCKARQGHPWN